MAQQVVEKVIRVDVVASAGAQKNIEMIASSMKKVDKTAEEMKDKLSSGFGGLEKIFQRTLGFLSAFGVAAGAGAIVRGILEMASAYDVLNSRLKIVLGSQTAANAAQRDIVDIAVRTGKDLDGTSKLYEKAARAAQQFGRDQSVASKITEAFSNSIRLSGSSTQEAYAAMVQFGQALASGRLQGDEFRSLMENNSVFMYEFAKAAGKSVTELRKMGSEGKVSTDFLFDTMLKKGADGLNLLERLNKMAGNVPLTFRQSATSLGSAVTAVVGEISRLLNEGGGKGDALGVFGPITRSMQYLTERVREAQAEMRAMNDTGFFAKLKAMFGAAQSAGFIPDIGSMLGLSGKEKPLADRLKDQEASDIKKLAEAQARLARQREDLQSRTAQGLPSPGAKTIIRSLEEDVTKLEKRIEATRTEAERLREAGRPAPPSPATKTPQDPSKEEKRAAEALKDFIDKMKEEAAVQTMLTSKKEYDKGVAQDLVRFEKLLAEAKADKNSKTAQEIRLLIQKTAFERQQLEINAKLIESRDKEVQQSDELLDKMEKQVQKDEAAILAIRNKTKASQELVSFQLKESRDLLSEKITSLYDFGAGKGDPIIQALEAQLAATDRAIAKRKELEKLQLEEKAREGESKLDTKEEKGYERTVDQINAALKRGLSKSNNVGETLYENIKDTFRDKTIDIIVNPVTDLAARVMAQFAQEVSIYLSNKVAEAFANSTDDPINAMVGAKGKGNIASSLLGLFGGGSFWGWGFATGIPNVPFDNMPARLHRGERVLTKAENDEMKRGSVGGRPVYVTYSPSIQIDARSDAGQIRTMVDAQIQEGNRRLVEDLAANGVV